jgi:hypothetical protein
MVENNVDLRLHSLNWMKLNKMHTEDMADIGHIITNQRDNNLQ